MVKLKGLLLAGLANFVQSESDGYRRIVCEDAQLAIRCPSGSKIRIQSAFYGRFESGKCRPEKTRSTSTDLNTNCSMDPNRTRQIIGGLCDDNNSCSFSLDSTMDKYEDPCPGTSKYLEYTYKCVDSNFECPGAVMAAVYTKESWTSYRNDGGWTTDSMDETSKVYYLPWDQSGASEIKEFRNMEDLQHSQQLTYYRLNDKADGTGFVVRGRKLYYNKRQSRELVMFDLERRYQELSVILPDANYYDTSPYSIEKNTDIDLAVDEYGLWAIYATESNEGKIVISQLDPNTLKILGNWNTGIEKTSVMEGWMTCGVFYAVQADSENLLFMYDTNQSREIRGREATKIVIPDLPESTTSIKYDPRARSLQVWSLGQMISYQLRFQPMSALYPTTTKKPTTTTTTTTSRSTTTEKKVAYNGLRCSASAYFGLQFPETGFEQIAEINCPDSDRPIRWKCGGNPKRPTWISDPDTTLCISDWIRTTHSNVERLASSEGLTQSRKLLTEVKSKRQELIQFDYLAILNMVLVIHDQNPKLTNKELQENLIKVIDTLMSTEEYPVWESMNQEMQSAIKSRETKALQQLLSRLSCKLRMSQHTFEFKTSQNIEIYLEPISSISKLPVEISFPEDTSNSPYRSLIMFTKGDQPQYLGALHTDCERPVSNYDIKYSFPKSNSRCSLNTGCVSIEQENRTVCKCPPTAGFITFDDDTSYDSYVAVEKEVSNTRQAIILAVFIFSALLHGAAFISSLMMNDSQMTNEGLNGGLRQSHQAINLCIMTTLITLAASAEMIFDDQMFCSVVSVVLHLLCILSFVWATIRPLFLSMFTLSQDRKLIGGCWLTSLVIVLAVLITAASATISMFSSDNDLCMTKASLGFTWSAAVIAIVLGAISMLLVCFSAIKMRENDFETFETQRVRSSLLWTGTFTVFLCCEWALIFLWLSATNDDQSMFGILLAVVALLHACLSFVNGCICNTKAQHGWRSALAKFGIRGQEEKSEFYWTRPPDGRDEFTIRPQMTAKGQMVGGQPDCVQMTYGNGYDQATMQLSQSQYSGQSNWTTCPPMNHPHPGHPMNNMAPPHGQYPTNYYPTNHGSHPAHAIYNQNHPIVSQTMASRDTNNYPDFRPAGSEFEFRTNQNAGMAGPVSNQNSQYINTNQRQQFLAPQANYDAEV